MDQKSDHKSREEEVELDPHPGESPRRQEDRAPRQSPAKPAPDARAEQAGPRDSKNESAEKQEPKKPPFYKRPMLMLVLGSLLPIAIVVASIWWLHARHFESTDDAFIDVHSVQISPNVAATVLAVHINDNVRVKKGDPLVELDPRDYQVVVDQMQANLVEANERVSQARVESTVATANVVEAQAELVVAQTNAANAQREYQRIASLNEEARSQQQLDNADAAAKSDAAQVDQARAKVSASEASAADSEVSIKTAAAAAKRAEADVAQAKINLGYCKICAPVDGMVTSMTVEPGNYVQKGDPLFLLVPTDVWVTANFKEIQLNDMRIGQDVSIKVDAYPGRIFHGKVESLENGTGSKFTLLPAENATGNYVKIVQRVPVKIVFNPGETDHLDVLLAPGLSVEPYVRVR